MFLRITEFQLITRDAPSSFLNKLDEASVSNQANGLTQVPNSLDSLGKVRVRAFNRVERVAQIAL